MDDLERHCVTAGEDSGHEKEKVSIVMRASCDLKRASVASRSCTPPWLGLNGCAGDHPPPVSVAWLGYMADLFT